VGRVALPALGVLPGRAWVSGGRTTRRQIYRRRRACGGAL